METWLLIVIIASVLVVGVILYLVLAGGDEEEQAAVEEGAVEITNLDKALAGLEKDGLAMTVGESKYLQISDDGAEGFAWAINEAGCADVVEVKVLDGKPGPKEEGEEEPAAEDEEAEKDEKKELRDGHEGEKEAKKEEGDDKKDLPVTYMEATAVGEGKCTFQMAWSDDADAIDWEEEKTWPEKVVAFDITVAAGEGEGDKKEEKAEKKEE